MPASRPERQGSVGYVLKKFPRLSETFVLSEILGMEREGFDVHVFANRPPDAEPRHAMFTSLRTGVTVLPRGRDDWHDDTAAADPRLNALMDALPEGLRRETAVQGAALARMAAERGIGHVHAHFATVATRVAAAARLLGGPPFSFTAHAKDLYRQGVDSRLFALLASLAYTVVTVCDANVEFLRRSHLRGSAARVERIYNGLDLSRFRLPAVQREKDLIVGLGRLVAKKGFDLAIEAAALLAGEHIQARLVLIGGGEEEGRLRALILQLGLQDRVLLLPAMPQEEALPWLMKARALVLPCRVGPDGNQDALPTVLLEALALGTPVVTTRVGGIPEIVDHDVHGLLVPEDDPKALSVALRRMLEDDALAERAAHEGPSRVLDRFDRRNTIRQLSDVFSASLRSVVRRDSS